MAGQLYDTTVGRLWVDDVGSGEAVVCWHSLFGSAEQFAAEVAALQGQCRLIVVEGPGHGRSQDRTAPFTMALCGEALVEILRQKEIARAVLVGVSWGSHVALEVALAHPDMVDGMVLMAAHAGDEPRRVRVQARLLATLYRWLPMPSFARFQAGRSLLDPTVLAAHPELVDVTARSFYACRKRAGYQTIIALFVTKPDLLARLPEIQAPTVVLVGAHDGAWAEERGRWVAERVGNGRLEVVEHAKHLLSLEVPEIVTRAIEGILMLSRVA